MSYDFPAHESTRKRRRWGCTCGCVMLLILLIVAGAAVSVIAFKPGKQFQRYALVDGQTNGFGILRINPEDEGVQDFSRFVLKRMQAAAKAEGAQSPQAKALSTVSKFSSNLLPQLFQQESMIYASYNPATADENILIATPLKNRFVWFSLGPLLENSLGIHPTAKDGLAQLYPLGAGDGGTSRVLSLDPDSLMITDHEPLLRKSLEYARNPEREAVPSEELQFLIDQLSLDSPPAGEDLAMAMVNEESRITNLIFAFEDMIGISGISDRIAGALAAQKLSFSDISGIKLTADLVSEDQINAQLTLYCPNPDTANRLAKAFDAALPHLSGNESPHGFKLIGKATGRGATTVVALELNGLKTWVERLIPVAAAPATPPNSAATPEMDNKTPSIAVSQE